MNIKQHRGRAAALAAVAAGALTLGGGPAAAGEQGVVAEHPDAPAVAAMRGITVEQAGERLDLERAAGALEADARRLNPGTFAGLWLDDADRVHVAFTNDASARAAALTRGFTRASAVRAQTRGRSLAALEALQQRLIADRQRARTGGLALPGIDGAGYDLDIDVKRNLVVLTAPDPTAATVADVVRRYGGAVEVRTGELGAPEACTRSDCKYTLRSGLEVNSPSYYCSSAFTVKRNDNGNRNLLSAAHCPEDGSPRKHGGVQYGTVQAQQESGRVDAERHSVGNNGFSASPWIYVNQDDRYRQVRGRGLYSQLAVDSSVCKSGATTYNTCGKVLSKTYSPSWVGSGGAYNFVSTTYCAEGGDSGAGVYIDNTALGVHSGGETGACDGSNFSAFGHIEFAQSALNATVMIEGQVPSFSSVSAANATTTIRARFSEPMLCDSVQPADFTATVNGVSTTVSAAACSGDSDSTIDLTVGTPLVTGTSFSVSLVGVVTDPAGNAAAKVTRSGSVTSTIAP